MKAKTVTVSLLVFAAAVVIAPVLRAQDLVKVAPKNCRAVLENDRVRMIRCVIKPGEALPMHSHPANIVYSLTAGKAKYTFADGKTEERELKAGQAVWSEAISHGTENTGTTESRALVVELKK